MASSLPTVAIIGQANVGKSALFNRLVRSQQAIVAREAGTTRDSVLGRVEYEEYTFRLIDTAGLKDPDDDFEITIQDQITEAIGVADVTLLVLDGTQYPTDEDKSIAKKALRSKKPVILVLNKSDLKGKIAEDEFRRLGIRTVIRTSAEHNSGIRELLDEITRHIEPYTEPEAQEDTLRVALIGRPNVGKSSLFNTLAGKQQAIVANLAGTTRDLNRITLRYKMRDIELIDTAGVRKQGKQEVGIEKFSVVRTLQAIEEADICLLLLDVNELNTALDQRLAGVIDEAGKGLVLVVSKWDTTEKDPHLRDELAAKISNTFDFTPWAPLIFTSSVTGQNVTKLFDIAMQIDKRRQQETKTRVLNDMLQKAVQKHPPAGLKNTHPKLRYIVQTDTAPPWFVIYGSNLKYVHWSYKRYLERLLRETYNYAGTPIKFSFRDEKQIKANKERAAKSHKNE